VISAVDARARTLAIDRPGWDGLTKPCGLECNAEAALEALNRGGVRRAAVVGYSLGGAVAAWLAATHPERVSRLVLVAPAANRDSLVALDYLLAAPVVGELTSAAALAGAGAALAARPLRRLVSAELEIDPRYLFGAARRALMPGTWRSFVSEQRMLIRELPLLEPLLSRIEAPTTVVVGSADRIVPPSSARALARQVPDAELIQIEQANHLLLQQHAKRLAEIMVA
jgi:pimeloyl-ACP methyl ester carboxylesterase